MAKTLSAIASFAHETAGVRSTNEGNNTFPRPQAHGYEPAREAAIAAFVTSWVRESPTAS